MKRFWLRCGLIAVALSCLLSVRPAHAATDLSVAPTNFVVSIDPGGKYDNVVLITNKDTRAVKLKAFVRAFKSASRDTQEGQVEFSAKLPLPPENYYKISINPANFTLDASETREVSFKITTTNATPPGGYYVGIVLQTVAEDAAQKERVAQFVVSEITIPILAQVSGAVRTKADITSFQTDKPSYSRGPVNFKLELKNSGNVHFAPIGRIDILSSDGQRVDSIPFKGSNILPNDTRTTEVSWNKWSLPLGHKQAVAYVFYEGDKLTKETTFEILPGSFLSSAGSSIGIVIGAIILFGFLGSRKKKKRRRR